MKLRSPKDLDLYYTEEELILMTSKELADAGFTHPRLFGSPDYYNQIIRTKKFPKNQKSPIDIFPESVYNASVLTNSTQAALHKAVTST